MTVEEEEEEEEEEEKSSDSIVVKLKRDGIENEAEGYSFIQ